jgi:hypothetical protein
MAVAVSGAAASARRSTQTRSAMRRTRATTVAFGRKVVEKEQLQGDEARNARQVKKVQAKLLGAFEVERNRLVSDDAVGANNARAALRDASSTRELRKAINYVEDHGALSSLAMLQMTCAYMDSPGWLEAQVAEGGSKREGERQAREAARDARLLKKVRSSLRYRKREEIEMVTQALASVMRKHLGHVPLQVVWRRWTGKVAQLKSKRALDERLAKQTTAVTEKRREQMEAWQSRASMVKSVDAAPGPDQEEASGEKPAFGIGSGGAADLSGEQERPSLAGFPSTELQLQLIQCRHTPAGPRRREPGVLGVTRGRETR